MWQSYQLSEKLIMVNTEGLAHNLLSNEFNSSMQTMSHVFFFIISLFLISSL